MTTHLYSAALGVAIVSMVGAYSAAYRRSPPPPVVAQEQSFHDSWNEDAARIAVAVVVPPMPKVAAPVPAKAQEEPPPPLPAIITEGVSEERVQEMARGHHRHRTDRGDVCAHHDMRKVHYGKIWRCKKR